MAESEILVAKESLSTTVDGEPVEIQAGVTHIRKGKSKLKHLEHLFEPVRTRYDIEQATAVPGEKRRR